MAKAFRIERRGRPKKTPAARMLAGEQEVLAARVIAFRQPHRQEVPEPLRDNPKASWPLGILNLCGAITDQQYQAGVYYGADVRRYRARFLPECPHQSPASIAGYMQPISGGISGTMTNKEIATKYNDAVNAVMQAGQKAAKAVARMAVFEERCPIGLEKMLNMGLSALVSHYRLTGR